MDLQTDKESIQGADISKWTMHSNRNIKSFTEGEIRRITENYKTIIGRGAFGEVYKGVLDDASMVAVKRLIHNVKENFDKELAVHREINHKNIVRLIGYCVGENALMMVTEYVPNGNLTAILHRDNTPIPLDIRLRIATQCAEALACMHSYKHTQVIHGDIKPDNILLDYDLNAKVSDFEISRLVNTDMTLYTGNVVGSIGYIDPLFTKDGRVTAKSDVYSFGVVLLELLTRKKATPTDGQVSVVTAFAEALESGRVREARKFLDSELDPSRNKNILDEMGKLAAECLKMKRDKRPEMKHVAERLSKSMKASLKGKLRKHPCRRFSYTEMVAATRNFDESHLLGQGGVGRFYRGVIDGGATMVAVERSWHGYEHNEYGDLFRSFVESRSKLNHINIVPLIGYCDENDERILVYTYIDHGSLHEHLFETQNPLTWKQRLEICIGVARGLHYLQRGAKHQGPIWFAPGRSCLNLAGLQVSCLTEFEANTPQLINHNLRVNILLDKEELVPKISANKMADPGLAELVGCDTGGRDCDFIPGDVADWLTEKLGVYSFGAVLLEVLCARPHFDLRDPEEKVNLQVWARRCKRDFNRIDPYLKGKINPQCYNRFLEIADECLAHRFFDHPSMQDVVLDLECALQLQVSAEVSGS